MTNCFILLAAGKGKRFKSNNPKQFTNYINKPLFMHSVDKALKSKLFKSIIIVSNRPIKTIRNKSIKVIKGILSLLHPFAPFITEELWSYFKDSKDKSRYEPATKWEHNNLIDVVTGKVIEFQNPGFEKLSRKIAEKKGYKVIGYKLELFAIKEACKKIK